ncbi:hypothetical protein ACSBM8_01860 [Sphingomonas sp. ASY06-1R]|uniref:hypothetical protein n=1 Tax=Sphingomonas sp. ASY06-1R TaxID=3445771 RepID=UPI003FA2D9AC
MPLMTLWLATAATAPPPADVKAFLERREQCAHWAGEEPYDAARGREIATAIRRLRCDRIDADAARLRQRYQHTPDITKLLDDTEQ